MAEHADGQIIVDTKIDTKGFRAESAELKGAIKSLGGKMDSLGPTFQKAMSGNANALSTFGAKSETLEKTIADIEDKMDSFGKKPLPTEKYVKVSNELNKIDREWTKLNAKATKMNELGVSEDSRAYQSVLYDVEMVAKKYAELREIKRKMESDGTASQLRSDTEEYKNLANALSVAKNKFTEMQSKMEQNKASTEQISSVKSEYEQLSNSLESIKNEYAQLLSALTSAQNQFAQLQSTIAKAKSQTNGFLSVLRNAPTLTERLKSALAGVVNVAARIGGAFKTAGSAAKNAFHHPLQTINKGIGSLISGLGYIGKKGVSAFSKVGSAIKTGVSRLIEFRKSAKSSGSSLSKLGGKLKGFTRMLKQMLMFRVFTGILTAVKDGLNNLAQYSTQTNKDLSALKSGLTQLKNSFAAAFAPILTVVTPILSRFINYLSMALTYVGKFFAALTGAKSFTKATAVQEDYAASLENTSEAAKDAQKQLAGFDELNNQSSSSESVGETDTSSMFEEVPIESNITGFVGQIKNALQSGDFSEIGEIVGEKINGVVEKIKGYLSWETVGGKITSGIEGIASGINSLISSIDWENIGDTAAQGLNTVMMVLFLIVTEFDWAGAAAALAQSLNGLIDGFDWTLLGTLISSGIKTALGTLRSAVTTFDWASLGSGIAESINNIDWPGIIGELAGFVSDLVSGALDGLIGFAETLDWEKLGSDLWNSLEAIVGNIDWSGIVSKLFQLLGAAVGGAGALVVGFCEEFWASLKKGFEDTKEYFGTYIEEAGGNVIEGLWNGIKNALSNVGNWIIENVWNPFKEGFCNAFGIHSPSTKMHEFGGFIVDGLLNGIKEIWHTVTDFFSTKFDEIGNTISAAWDSIKTTASTAWSGIKNTVSSAWSGIKTGVSSACSAVKNTVSSAWTSVKNNVSTSVNNAKTAASNAWNSIKTTASSMGENIKTAVSTSWENTKTAVSTKLSGIKTDVSDAFSTLKSSATTWGKDLCENMANGIEKAKSNVESAVSNVASKIKSFLGFSEPEDGPLSNFHTYMPDMIDLMVYGIKKNEGKAVDAVSKLAGAVSSEIQSGDYSFGEISVSDNLDTSFEGFADKIVNGFEKLISRLNSIANSVTFIVPAVAGSIVPYTLSENYPGKKSVDGDGDAPSFTEIIEAIQRVEKKLESVVEAIDEKETGITDEEIYNSVKSSARKEQKSTGKSPF